MLSILLATVFKIIALLLVLDQTEFFCAFLKTVTILFDRSLLSDSAVITDSRQFFRLAQVSSAISVTYMPVGKTTFILVTDTRKDLNSKKKLSQ